MNVREIILLAGLLALVSLPVRAADRLEDAREALDGLLKSYVERDTGNMLRRVLSEELFSNLDQQSWPGVIRQFEAIYDSAGGTPTDFELLQENRLGSHLMVLRYVVRFDLSPMTAEFFLYESPNGWRLNNLNFHYGDVTKDKIRNWIDAGNP